MANVITTPFPVSVPEQERRASDYFDIRPSALAFGGGTAAGLEKLGAGLEKSGEEVFTAYRQQQELVNQIAADDASNQYQDRVIKTLYGDPSTGDEGYFALRGKDAHDAWPKVAASLSSTREGIGAGLNRYQRLEFDRNTRRAQQFYFSQIGRHYEEQTKVYGAATSKAMVDLAAQDAGLNYNDDGAFQRNLIAAQKGATRLSESVGAHEGSPIYQENMQEALSKVVTSRALGMSKSDPAGAEAFIRTYRSMMNDKQYEQLQAHLGPAIASHIGNEALGARGGGAGGGASHWPAAFVAPAGAPIQGATPEEQQFLNEFRHRESGGKYDSDGPIANGEAHTGAYQFADSTWRRAAAATGMGQEFKQARNAPPAVQDANALWLFRNEGSGPWTASGPYPQTGKGAAPVRVASAAQPIPAGTAGAAPSTQAPRAEAMGQSLVGAFDYIDQQVASGRLPAEYADQAKAHAETRWRAEVADVARLEAQRQKEWKQQAQSAETDIIRDYESNNPKITPQQIANDPRFARDPEMMRTMIDWVSRADRLSPMQSQAAAGELMQDMLRPWGDPLRINDRNQIFAEWRAGHVNRGDTQFLLQQLEAFRTPEGERWSAALRTVLDSIKPSITKQNLALGTLDSSGGAAMWGYYQSWVEAMRQQSIKDNKDPMRLLNPTSPDYVGTAAAVKPFQRSLQEAMKAGTTNIEQPAPVPPFPSGVVMPSTAQPIPAPLPTTGLLTPGNIDLANRPVVKNPGGTISTVLSMSFEEDGKEILVPKVAEDGSRILSNQEAIEQYHKTGKFLGKFDTPEHAIAYAEQLHHQQAQAYAQPPGKTPMNPGESIDAYRARVGMGVPSVTAPTAVTPERHPPIAAQQ